MTVSQIEWRNWRRTIGNANSAVRAEEISARQQAQMQLRPQLVEQIGIQAESHHGRYAIGFVLPQLAQNVGLVVILRAGPSSIDLPDVRMVGNKAR